MQNKVFSLVSLFAFFILHFALTPQVFASSPGTTTGELLKVPLGARAIGMGEAYTGLANDASALYWNPAGMSFVTRKEASFQHSSLLESVHLEQLSFVAPGDTYAFGTNLSYLGYGTIAGYDNSGAPTGEVSAYSYLLNGGVSRMINESLSVGLSAGLLHETLAQDSANTLAINGGALYQLSSHLWGAHYNLGMSLLNIGPGLKFVSERDPLPSKLIFGLAALGIKEKPINVTADIGLPNDNSPYLSFGAEYWFHDIVALRLGYAGSNDEGKGLRVGLGLKYSDFRFDYAYGGYGDFGAMQRVNLSMRWGERIKQLNNEERAILKEAKASEREGAYVLSIMNYEAMLNIDPTNDRVLRMMIDAHDKLVQNEVHNDVAMKAIPIPTAEEAAAATIVPETAVIAQIVTPGPSTVINPNDPLDLNRLPDLNTLDVAVAPPVSDLVRSAGSVSPSFGSGTASHENAPAFRADPTFKDTSIADTPALSASDIYGN